MSQFKLSKYDQIGILVKDIEKAAKSYSTLLDFKGKLNIVDQTNTVFYKGKEATFKMKKIMQYFGGLNLKLLNY